MATVGLRHWTVELDRAAEVEDVRGCLEAAGIRFADTENGFAASDPWGIEFRVRAAQ